MRYGNELRSSVDPEKFFSYYAKSNWTTNGQRIDDWKALFRAWDRRQPKTNVTVSPAAGKKKPQLATMNDPEFADYVKWFTGGGYKEISGRVNGK